MSTEECERYSRLVFPLRSKMSVSQKIEMYGLWCVAQHGKCTRKQPSRAKILEYGKWAAWKKYEPVGQKRARELFVEKAKAFLVQYPSKL
ncbi:hypothetical protein JKF63_01830 [Porcisia hertigi]|uniref:ACB domain-containing protein n=1 Tax=Porcisia hertigi TaxID=2761500 RepID=A0A836HWX4_9TRYP|nr:hypothetical protein JKF63_01830 [Porcisia hertigi]